MTAMTARAGRGQRGLSLIEIPVALLILGIVLILAAGIFSTAGHVHSDSRLANQATAMAAAKLTELESMPVSQIEDGRDSVAAANGLKFARKWSVDRPIAGSQAKSISIEVHWSSNRKDQFVQVATLIR
jgi:prepilin-type N-terminal cleavage/methylation domain-containing protein